MTVESTNWANDPANFTDEAKADRAKESELRAAFDEAAINYYCWKMEAGEDQGIAQCAMDKTINEKWTVERRNKLLAAAYTSKIRLEESRLIFEAAFDALQNYIYIRDYVIPTGNANNLPVIQDNRTVLDD